MTAAAERTPSGIFARAESGASRIPVLRKAQGRNGRAEGSRGQMMRFSTEERLGVLLRLLRPAPIGWVRAAQELPAARRTFDEIVARAEADVAFRAALLADLERALTAEGYEPDRRVLDEIRVRLTNN